MSCAASRCNDLYQLTPAAICPLRDGCTRYTEHELALNRATLGICAPSGYPGEAPGALLGDDEEDEEAEPPEPDT